MKSRAPLQVYLTCDVEIWCESWTDIDAQFADAFRRYVYGPTARGDHGLPFHLALLREHGLTGVFFVEPLFSARFGAAALAEIVGLLQEGGQEVQLHLHTEWADEARPPLLSRPLATKHQHIRQFSRAEQAVLIGTGARLLQAAGAESPSAFRAGSFALNRDTLGALADCGILIDSSYNPTMFGTESGIQVASNAPDALTIDGVCEVPMTVFTDGFGRSRHAQVGACSSDELEQLLWQAHAGGRRAVVLLSHNFEALNQARTGPDPIVAKRMARLCRFLASNRQAFSVGGFREHEPRRFADGPPSAPLRVSTLSTVARVAQQAVRRSFG